MYHVRNILLQKKLLDKCDLNKATNLRL